MSERRMNDYKLFVKTVHIYSYEVYYLNLLLGIFSTNLT